MVAATLFGCSPKQYGTAVSDNANAATASDSSNADMRGALLELLKRLELAPDRYAYNAVDKLLTNPNSTDSTLKQTVAKECYNFFKESKIMGKESIAVYIAKNYFLSGKIEASDSELGEMAYFVTVNEGTLLGKKAPQLSLKDTSGSVIELGSRLGEYTIIYFWSDNCPFCKAETPKLMEFADNFTFAPLNIYCVYTGTDSKAWKREINEQFATQNPFAIITHVADIERDSRFPVDYGVTSTPKLFLLNAAHRVIGRKLTTATLKELLKSEEERALLRYDMLKVIFPNEAIADGLSDTSERFRNAERICQELAEDEESIKQMYLYLIGSDYYPNQLTAAYIGEKYICGRKESWEDSVFANNVCLAIEQFNKNRLGERAADLNLRDISDMPAQLLQKVDDGKYQVLFFYNTTCSICTQMLPKLNQLYSKYGSKAKFTGIYIGDNISSLRSYIAKNRIGWRQLWGGENREELGKKYDTETVPHIYLLNSQHIVIAKDIDVTELESLLQSR